MANAAGTIGAKRRGSSDNLQGSGMSRWQREEYRAKEAKVMEGQEARSICNPTVPCRYFPDMMQLRLKSPR